MRVSMRVCHATTPERAECVDLRMRHVWSSSMVFGAIRTCRSFFARQSRPSDHAARSWLLRGCFRCPPGPAPATRERTIRNRL